MKRPAMNIRFLVICCLWFHVQPTSAAPRCPASYGHRCAGGNNKRADINDLPQAADLGTEGEESDLQEVSEEERRGDVRESDGFRGDTEGDDLSSEIGDRRQLLEEKQLLDIFNRRNTPRPVPVEEEQKLEQRQEEEPPRQSDTDTNRRYKIEDTADAEKNLGRGRTQTGFATRFRLNEQDTRIR